MQAWTDLLRADSRALEAWCGQRSRELVANNAELGAFVEIIDRSVDNPCD